MIAIAPPSRQPAFSSLPSFHNDNSDVDFEPPSSSFGIIADLDEGEEGSGGLLDLATPSPSPPRSMPMRRSLRKLRSSNKRRGSGTVVLKRTLSQKRRREHVSFRDDGNLVQVEIIPPLADDLNKSEIWYDSKELTQMAYEELNRNWQIHMTKGAMYPLEKCNLSWRGLEEHVPSPADNLDNDEYEVDGVQERMEKIRNHVSIVLAIARTIKRSNQQDDWEHELADRSCLLSKSDRNEAIEKAQKDAYEALREHGVEHGPPRSYNNNNNNSNDVATCTALVSNDNNSNSGGALGVIETLVTWFCL